MSLQSAIKLGESHQSAPDVQYKKTQNTKKRRSREGDGETPTIASKKVRLVAENDAEPRKRTKAVPQSLRGTAIRPQQPEGSWTVADRSGEGAVAAATVSHDNEPVREVFTPSREGLSTIRALMGKLSGALSRKPYIELNPGPVAERGRDQRGYSASSVASSTASESRKGNPSLDRYGRRPDSSGQRSASSCSTPTEPPTSAGVAGVNGSGRKDDVGGEEGQEPDEVETQSPSPRSPNKRKNISQHREAISKRRPAAASKDNHEVQIEIAAKRQRPKESLKIDQSGDDVEGLQGDGRGKVSGAWSNAEKELADKVFGQAHRANDLTAGQLKALVIDWANITIFKQDMYDAFPERTYTSIRKFCQRRYTTFQRGPWTDEQDERLLNAYVEFPDQWATISEQVERLAPDCRDRYRNILQYRKTMESGPWSSAEEAQLRNAVKECLKVVRKDCKDLLVKTNSEALESLIDWKTVSKKMEGKRSSKRCHEKWQKLKHRDAKNAVPTAVADKQSLGQKRARRDLSQCGPGDIFDVLMEISTAVDDRSKVFHDETTFWAIVATKHPQSRFSGGLRILAFRTSLVEYGCKKAEKAQTIAAKAEALVVNMRALEQKGEISLNRKFSPRPKKSRGMRKKKEISRTIVEDESGEDVEEAGGPQTPSVDSDDEESFELSSPNVTRRALSGELTAYTTNAYQRD